MQDLAIGYVGGSGGFLLLHLLLLSDQYNIAFNKNVSVSTAINQQWNIKNHLKWKQNEYWPDNQKTFALDNSRPKIYFYCNPKPSEYAIYPGRNITLYTDINSQLALTKYKNAYWYYRNTEFGNNRRLLLDWQKLYSVVQDPSWPVCKSHRHIDKLPEHIKKELMANQHTRQYIGCNNWRDYYRKNRTVIYQNNTILDSAHELITWSNDAILLQDLVNSQAEILVAKQLVPNINSDQRELLDCWKKLHNTTLLESIGIKKQ